LDVNQTFLRQLDSTDSVTFSVGTYCLCIVSHTFSFTEISSDVLLNFISKLNLTLKLPYVIKVLSQELSIGALALMCYVNILRNAENKDKATATYKVLAPSFHYLIKNTDLNQTLR